MARRRSKGDESPIELPGRFKELLDVFLKVDVELELNHLAIEYFTTDNAALVWEAWRLAREASIAPPDWIFSYLDDVARNIHRSATEGCDDPHRLRRAKHKDPHSEIVKGLGLHVGRGQTARFEQEYLRRRDRLARRIKMILESEGVPMKTCGRRAAAAYLNTSPATIDAIWWPPEA